MRTFGIILLVFAGLNLLVVLFCSLPADDLSRRIGGIIGFVVLGSFLIWKAAQKEKKQAR